MKRKFLGIFLLFALVVPISTSVLWLNYQKKQVRREVKRKITAGLDKSDLVLIALPTQTAEKELIWIHSKEFEYRQEMYDVVDTELRNDSVFYWCWWDHEETKLNQLRTRLANLILSKDTQRKGQKDRVLQFYKSLFFQSSKSENSIAYLEKRNYFSFQVSYCNISLLVPNPPPEFSSRIS